MLQMLQSYSALLFACNLPLMMKLRAMDSDIAWKGMASHVLVFVLHSTQLYIVSLNVR